MAEDWPAPARFAEIFGPVLGLAPVLNLEVLICARQMGLPVAM